VRAPITIEGGGENISAISNFKKSKNIRILLNAIPLNRVLPRLRLHIGENLHAF
jgi:hypothetical protein